MYCSTCATPLAPGLSYCNRCGANLKEREHPKTGAIGAYLTAITIIGVAGLVFMLGGAIALKNTQFHEEPIGIFMFMIFSLVGMIEFLLCRQLSRLIGGKEKWQSGAPQPPAISTDLRRPTELGGPQPRALPDPIPSVTENTTRTLAYSRDEPTR